MTTISAVSSIAASGLYAAQARLNASASNVANSQSGGAAPGAATSSRPLTTYQPVAVDQSSLAGGGVAVSVRMVQPGYFMAYEPDSPNADAHGMEAMPDVDLGLEAVNQMQASRQYEANLKVLDVANQMQKAALKIDV